MDTKFFWALNFVFSHKIRSPCSKSTHKSQDSWHLISLSTSAMRFWIAVSLHTHVRKLSVQQPNLCRTENDLCPFICIEHSANIGSRWSTVCMLWVQRKQCSLLRNVYRSKLHADDLNKWQMKKRMRMNTFCISSIPLKLIVAHTWMNNVDDQSYLNKTIWFILDGIALEQ